MTSKKPVFTWRYNSTYELDKLSRYSYTACYAYNLAARFALYLTFINEHRGFFAFYDRSWNLRLIVGGKLIARQATYDGICHA